MNKVATKHCGKCNKDLLLHMFAKNSAKKDGLQERCKSCRANHHQKVKHKRPKPTVEQKRKYVISSYGITVEQFYFMLQAQDNKCAICKTKEWGKPSPSIDHCHTTGVVRGLLCNNCNRALGLFRDNKEAIQNAAKYLSRFN